MKFDDLLREYFGPKPGWHAIYKKRPDAFKDPKCKRKIMKRFPFQPDPIKMEMQRDPKKTLFSMIMQDRIAADQGEWSGGTLVIPFGKSVMSEYVVPMTPAERFKHVKSKSAGWTIESIRHGCGVPPLTWGIEDGWGSPKDDYADEWIVIRDGLNNITHKLPVDTDETTLQFVRIAIYMINRSDRDDGQ